MLRLIAHGLSNTEISHTLVIAEQTTKTYVSRILASATAPKPSCSPLSPA